MYNGRDEVTVRRMMGLLIGNWEFEFAVAARIVGAVNTKQYVLPGGRCIATPAQPNYSCSLLPVPWHKPRITERSYDKTAWSVRNG